MLTTSTSIFRILQYSPNNSFSSFNFTPFFHSLSFLLSRTNHVGDFAHFHHTRLAFFLVSKKKFKSSQSFHVCYILTQPSFLSWWTYMISIWCSPFFSWSKLMVWLCGQIFQLASDQSNWLEQLSRLGRAQID
jgi:hypothetical protein